ncbi:RILP-like protein 1 isoform X2 [Emydura macquarii macquarii]|uniref:RILP-like protein 1 isoform X2 n=1 Tax=Emydura macquarii macquarii TaxID=1129001 RepID=UPI00352B5E28
MPIEAPHGFAGRRRGSERLETPRSSSGKTTAPLHVQVQAAGRASWAAHTSSPRSRYPNSEGSGHAWCPPSSSSSPCDMLMLLAPAGGRRLAARGVARGGGSRGSLARCLPRQLLGCRCQPAWPAPAAPAAGARDQPGQPEVCKLQRRAAWTGWWLQRRGGGRGRRRSMRGPRGPRGAMEGGGESPAALEKNVAELTVMDVYDIASVVGQEFERLIDQHGCEAIARLMPKVVRVLEILEVLVSRNHINPELEELRLELDRLRLERMDRIEKEKKHQKELELVEDVWRGEAQDLLTQIAQLQEENKQLMTNLSHKDINFTEEEFQKHEGMSERERQVMKKLKEVVDKQRDEIRAKDRELGLKNEDVEALQQQQNRLMKINHDLRHRITVVEAQGKALIEQKVELEAYLQTKEQEMGTLRAEVGKLREKLPGEHSQNGEEIMTEPNNDDYLSESEKMALDLKDPNRPRFTLQELRDVLHERNELKSKVFLLQEELLYYKSEETEDDTRSPQSTSIINSKTSTQPESGIKRLFSFFSRDKKRMQATQQDVHFQDSFGEWADSNKDDSYTEQGQEALQHL